jgi:hypothetical protein
MPRKRKGSGLKPAKRRNAAPKEEALVREGAPLAGRVIERPDGFYWEAKKGEPHGPFETLAEAEADMLAGGATEEEDDVEVPGALQEAESELGVSEWIDPDTGGPAEDNVPRIEDH